MLTASLEPYERPTLLWHEQSSIRRCYGLEVLAKMLYFIEKAIPPKKTIPHQNIKIMKIKASIEKRYLRTIALMSGCLHLQMRAIQTYRDSSLSCTLLADAIELAQHVLTKSFEIRFQAEI